MKRILSIVLALVLVLGLCACGGEKDAAKTNAPTGFRVGFGRANITPSITQGLQMEGYSGQVSEGFLSYIWATCIAITDEQDNTLLLYTVDKGEVEKNTINALRSRITEKYDIPADNITISATHTHSTPKTTLMPDYIDQLFAAGEEALKDRSPATIAGGSHDVPNMNFVRHYVMSDGSMVGDNYGNYLLGFADYASQADPTMRLIRFQRENKKDVVMVNWQVHPKLTSTADTPEGKATRNMISSDFIGYTRDYLEAKEDILFAYFNGASANVNPFSKLDSDKNIVSKEAKVYGEQLGDHVIAALADLQTLETGKIASSKAPLADRGFELHAYSIGSSLGFATVPAEIFDTTGNQIRDGSPNQITFVLTCANGRDTYIPVKEVWDYYVSNGDVPYEVRICRYPQGTAEILAETLVGLLNDLQK